MLIGFIFFSCKKEDLLDNVSIIPSEYDRFDNHYVTAEVVRQVACDMVSFDIVIHMELLPDRIRDNIDKYKVRIETPFGEKRIADRYDQQWVKSMCDTINEYKVSLYQSVPERESNPFVFTFRTNK